MCSAFIIVISAYEYFLTMASAQNTVEGVAPTQAATNQSAPSEPQSTTSRNPVDECATQGVPVPAHKADNQDLHVQSGSQSVPGHGHEPNIPPPPNPGAKNLISPPDKTQAVPIVDINVNTKTTMSSSTPNGVQIVHRLSQAESFLASVWEWEIANCCLSTLCLIILSILLITYKDQPVSSWSLYISINFLIAVFSAIMKASLMMGVSEGSHQPTAIQSPLSA